MSNPSNPVAVAPTIFRQPVLWLGVAASVAIAAAVGTQRAGPGVPSWWNYGLGAASLVLFAGVAVATVRTRAGVHSLEMFHAIRAYVFWTSILMLFTGFGWVLIAQEERGIVETLKGTCFMYAGVGILASIATLTVEGLIRMVATMPTWTSNGWIIVAEFFFVSFWLARFVSLGGIGAAFGSPQRITYADLILLTLGLKDDAHTGIAILAWGSIVGAIAGGWYIGRNRTR